MTTSKNCFGLLLALVALGSIAACDSDDDPSGPPCVPEGTYTLEKQTFSATEGLCAALAGVLNASAEAQDGIVTKLDATTYESRNASDANDTPTRLTLDAVKCELNSTRKQMLAAKDSAGKDISLILDGTITAKLTGNAVESRGEFRATTTTAGATGLPCTLTTVQKGTKK